MQSVISQISIIWTRLNKCIVDNYYIAKITVLWMHGLAAILLVQIREEMAVLSAGTAVLSHPSITIYAVRYIIISSSSFPLIHH